MSPFSNGCSAVSLIFVSVGAITKRLRNSESPITTWFGGIAVSPIALRVSESTITIRVKLVSITISAGAIASTVSKQDDDDALVGFAVRVLAVLRAAEVAEIDRDRTLVGAGAPGPAGHAGCRARSRRGS